MAAVLGDGYQTDGILSSAGQLSVTKATHTITIPEAPADTLIERMRVPSSGATLSTLKIRTVNGVGASAAGTYLLTASKEIDGGSVTNVLSASSENLEALTDQTDTGLTLTGTAANLDFADGDFLKIDIASNNSDLTGGNGILISASWIPTS